MYSKLKLVIKVNFSNILLFILSILLMTFAVFIMNYQILLKVIYILTSGLLLFCFITSKERQAVITIIKAKIARKHDNS